MDPGLQNMKSIGIDTVIVIRSSYHKIYPLPLTLFIKERLLHTVCPI